MDYGPIFLIHWGLVTHICVSRLTIIGSDNGLSPDRRQAIIWTNAGKLLIVPFGTKFSQILIKIYTCSFRKMHLKMSSGKWQPFCLGLNVLTWCTYLLRKEPYYINSTYRTPSSTKTHYYSLSTNPTIETYEEKDIFCNNTSHDTVKLILHTWLWHVIDDKQCNRCR